MKKSIALFTAAALLGCAGGVYSQSVPTAQSVLSKVSATYKSMQSLSAECNRVTDSLEGEKHVLTNSRSVSLFQRPFSLSYSEDDTMSRKMAILYINDGKQAYSGSARDETGPFVPSTMDELKEGIKCFVGDTEPLGLLTLDNPFTKAKSAEIVGSEKVDGIDTHVIDVRWSNNRDYELLFVGKTDYLIHRDVTHAERTTEEARKHVPEKYWDQVKAYNKTRTTNWTKLQPNAKLDPAVFALPKGAVITERPKGKVTVTHYDD